MQKTLSVINLTAIEHNARLVRSLIGDRFFYAVVKADAYGHGAGEVSRAIESTVDGFCVAIAEEGVELRISGITKPVLVLAPPLGEDDVARMRFYNLTPTVADEASARLVRGGPCQIAVNTGMNRYGTHGEGLLRVLDALGNSPVTGVYSHLYCAEDEDICSAQLAAFKQAEAAVKESYPSAVSHLAASGGILRGGGLLLQGVRCGLLLYGYAPAGFERGDFKPALTVYARLAQATEVTGGGVGYNRADERYERLFTYRLGYADGFSRIVSLGEKTLCMDAFVSKRGEKLLNVFSDADEYAARCGTISYEALCSVTRRSQRVYERRIKT